MRLFYSSLLGKLRKEGNIPPAFSFSFFNCEKKVAGKYPHELKNRVMARDSIVFKSYVMWLEVESFLLTIFWYNNTVYYVPLCWIFFKKRILYLDIHVIYKGLGKWTLVRKKADISFHLCELTPVCHNILYFGKFVYFIEILKKQKDYYKLRGFFLTCLFSIFSAMWLKYPW